MKGLYIHIPFCKRKCKYCDFVSYIGREAWIDKYIDALKKEAAQYEGEKINTVFVGGGTPSLLSPVQINHVTKMCSDFFDLADACEFTMEVNPGTLDNAKMEAMLADGFAPENIRMYGFAFQGKECMIGY